MKASSSKCQSREAHQKPTSVLVILNVCDCMPLACSCVQDYPSIMVVGHSLGGGVASIIALLLRTYFSDHTRGRNVQCFAFSPPGCVFRYVCLSQHLYVCIRRHGRCRDGEVRIQRALKLANVDLGCSNVIASPSLFLPFFRQLVFLCSYLIGGTIPTSLLVLVENIFTPLIYIRSLTFDNCACVL